MNASSARLWRLSACDSWFFRESRPFDSIGGAILSGRFPPPARTLLGAIRTAMGETASVDWDAYNRGDPTYAALRAQMGDARSFGSLKMRGPFLLDGDDVLYPSPLLLLRKDAETVRLVPDDTVRCDLGSVRLPRLERPLPGAAPLENTFLKREEMERVLAGGVPSAASIPGSSLWSSEERLGIGRDNARRTGEEGLLYQTRHVRLHDELSLGVQIEGVDARYQPALGQVRLGGEGRFAFFETSATSLPTLTLPPIPSPRLVLMLLTPARFRDTRGDATWHPPGFVFDVKSGCWQGEINGVSVLIVCSIVGKPVREGGWDLVAGAPRAMSSLVPSGSCFFCEVEGDAQDSASRLHHTQVGEETVLGRGEIVVGCWPGATPA